VLEVMGERAMRRSGHLWRPVGRVVVAGVLGGLLTGVLAGCGGSADDKASGSDDAKSSAKPDYQAASQAITKLSNAYGQVAQADVAAQQAAVAYLQAHPTGALDDPAITTSQDKLTESFAKRDELRDALADLSALKDPDVKQAYDSFISQAVQQDAFNDGYYTAFPAYRASLERCLDVFQIVSDSAPETSSPIAYGKQLMQRHDAAARDCKPVLTELSGSKNAMVAAYAKGSLTAVDERRSVLEALAAGDLGIPEATTRFVAATKAFNKNLDTNTRFPEELDRLSAREHFAALQKAIESKQQAG
jgi:hypothetical protein